MVIWCNVHVLPARWQDKVEAARSQRVPTAKMVAEQPVLSLKPPHNRAVPHT